MSDADKFVEFITKFGNVQFRTVPPNERPNPENLSPEMRESYERIVAAGGAEFVFVAPDGRLGVSGTFTQFRKDGSAKADQDFVAYSSVTKNGKKLDFAADMIEKFLRSPNDVGYAKVRVVQGRKDGKGGRFQSLEVLFPQTAAERDSWLASRAQVEGQKAPAAVAAGSSWRAAVEEFRRKAAEEFPLHSELIVKFSDVEFSIAPANKPPNPEKLSSEGRASYDRIVANGGAKFVSVTEKGDLCVSGTLIYIRENGVVLVGQRFVAYNSFAADMIEKFRSLDDVGLAKVRIVQGRPNGKGGYDREFLISSSPDRIRAQRSARLPRQVRRSEGSVRGSHRSEEQI